VKKINLLIMTALLLTSSLAGAQAISKLINLNDYPIYKFDIQTENAKTKEDYADAIDNALVTTIQAEKDETLQTVLLQSAIAFLTKPLTPNTTFPLVENFSSGIITNTSEVQEESLGSSTLTSVKISGNVVGIPLFLRFLVMHELMGHHSQYFKMLLIPGLEDATIKTPQFQHDFSKMTHPTAALMELQFLHAVPREFFLEDVNASNLNKDLKASFVRYVNRAYDNAKSPREYIKNKALDEANFSMNETGVAISDSEFEIFFEHIKTLGFDVDSLTSRN
jgi:hypothetical protein